MLDPPTPLRSRGLSLRAALDAAGVAIAAVGLEGHILSASSEFARAFASAPEDLVGMHLIGLCSPGDQPEILAGLSRVVGDASRLERRVLRVPDGSGGATTLRCTFARPDDIDAEEIIVVLGAALTSTDPAFPAGADRRRRSSDPDDAPAATDGPAAHVHPASTAPALVDAALRRSGRHGRPFASIRVGLDAITTQLAATAGSGALAAGGNDADPDQVAAALGERMLHRLRPGDQVCHHDRDGFTVLAEDLGDVQDAAGVAYRLLSMAVEPLAVRGAQVRVTLTVGLAVADGAASAAEIPAAASRALTEARADGVGGFRIVDLRSGLAA